MKTLIIANWKCNPTTLQEARQLFNLVKKGLKNINNKKLEIVICPPFSYLQTLNLNRSPDLELGGQNCFWEESGAFTGEISALMLKNLGCQYVILGHSERRKYFLETDEVINKKLKSALEAKLTPILCVGETQAEKEKGLTKKILRSQIKNGFKGIRKRDIRKIIVAYEPVWAIGTGHPCWPTEAERIGSFIRKIISQISSKKMAKNVKIIYGGSVNSQNAAFYIFEAKLQGLLVGGASLNAQEFIKIIKNIKGA